LSGTKVKVGERSEATGEISERDKKISDALDKHKTGTDTTLLSSGWGPAISSEDKANNWIRTNKGRLEKSHPYLSKHVAWTVKAQGRDNYIAHAKIDSGIAKYLRDNDIDAPEVHSSRAWSKTDILSAEVKAGRTISAATRAKLMAARDVIDELCRTGEDPEGDEMEKQPAPERAADEQENKAGPVIQPPTSAERLLKLIELELSTLEV